MSGPERFDGDREDKAELRKEHPSGWLYLTQHDHIPILIDALLDFPPDREFTISEFADHAGVARSTVDDYTDLLLEVEIIEPVSGTSPRQYQVATSGVVRELFELNSALNVAGQR